MRAVRVEEAAAVGAELLDGLLRRDRSLRNRLPRAFDGLHRVVVLQVLHGALRHVQERADEADWRPAPERAAPPFPPEFADRLLLLLPEPADEGDGHRDAAGGRDEVVVR